MRFRIGLILMLLSWMLGMTYSPVTAQELSFSTPSGPSVQLSDFKGKVVILLFAGIQDPQCRDEFHTLNTLADRYHGKNVIICWVSINSFAQVPNEKLVAPCGPVGSVLVLRDASQAAFKRFSRNIAQLPTLVIIDKSGQAHGQPYGGFNPTPDFLNTLFSEIDSLL